jgi:hypothetical protein
MESARQTKQRSIKKHLAQRLGERHEAHGNDLEPAGQKEKPKTQMPGDPLLPPLAPRGVVSERKHKINLNTVESVNSTLVSI